MVTAEPALTPGQRLPLSRERVLRTAVAIADEHGIEAVTMRRVGDELGAEAMSLIASAALNGEDAGALDDTMSAAADECGVSQDAFDDQFDSDPFAYGDDPELDALYDSCAGGDGAACDDLYLNSAAGSEYEQFAGTCGDRFEYSDTEPCDGRV